MKTQQLPTEEELAEVLQDDAGLFMQALYEYYAGKIMAWLGKASFDVLDEQARKGRERGHPFIVAVSWCVCDVSR